MNKKKFAGYALVACAFGALGAIAGMNKADGPITTAYASTNGKAHTAVERMYGMTLKDASGKPQAMAQWQGKAMVINFWATWCAPCVREMPELDAMARELAAKNIAVIGIGIDSPSNIAQFAGKLKISYPVYAAGMEGTDLARELGNTQGGLPYTVLIGADGAVRKTYLGQIKFDQLRADLAAL